MSEATKEGAVELVVIIHLEEPIHPEIVRDDLAELLYQNGWDCEVDVREGPAPD